MLDSAVPSSTAAATSVLTTSEWQLRATQHFERVQRYTQPHRERQSRRESHPVYDFLFQYYPYSAAKLEAWHPAPCEALVDSETVRECFRRTPYRAVSGLIVRDAAMLPGASRERFSSVLRLLTNTRERTPNFACFGMHEWAMVFGGNDVRHADIAPLRLAQHEVDALVSSHPVACSHFDAFRFFAPAAKPMNRVQLTRSTVYEHEQPGCIHANMDLYRWACALMPWIGSDVLWQCFDLAADLRLLDMQASPYDLRAFGCEPVCVETANGRNEYQRRQRELGARAAVLRDQLVDVLDTLLHVRCKPAHHWLAIRRNDECARVQPRRA